MMPIWAQMLFGAAGALLAEYVVLPLLRELFRRRGGRS